MTDVFISYMHRDADVAARLAGKLRQAGIGVFWDHDIPSGRAVTAALSRAITEAKVFVFIDPGQEGPSAFFRKEIEAAMARNVSSGLPVLPVVLPGRDPTGDVSRFRYLKLQSLDEFLPVIKVVKQLLNTAELDSPTRGSLQLSFLARLLSTDLHRAPSAAAIVLDEISQSVDSGSPNAVRELKILRHAVEWGQSHLGMDNPSVTSLRYRLAETLINSGHYMESIALSSEALEVATNPKDRLEASMNLGNALVSTGRFEEAEEIYGQGLQVALSAEYEAAVGTLLVALGTVARHRGDIPLAVRYFEDAVARTARLSQPSARVNALIALCEIMTERGDRDQSRRYAEEALWLSRTALAGDDTLALRAAALAVSEGLDR